MPAICPYCRSEVAPEQPDARLCEGCGTPHHLECYEENGGCTLFGCKFAPPDDPKVQVTAGDVSQAAVFPSDLPNLLYARPTGFGDVNASTAVAVLDPAAPPPPPPPPPGSELSLTPAESVPSSPPGILFNATPHPPKARLTFILLGIFLGCFGAHNFYAGYTKRGLAQLALTVCTVFYASFVTWIWALVEVCTVDHDNNNVNFA